MKKIIWRRLLSVLVILAIVIASVFYAQENLLILNDHSVWRTRNFYKEDDNSIDVVLLGASEVFSGYSAGLAYEEYGFTSYPFALDSASIEIWKSQIKEVYKRQKPKLIIVEINSALYLEDEKIFDDASLRRYVDNIPYSINRIETLLSCRLQEDPISYWIPFIKYHGNITDAPQVFREKKYYDDLGYSCLRGLSTYTFVDKSDNLYYVTDKMEELNTNAEEYLMDFLGFCKENEYNVVFTRFPHKYINLNSMDNVFRKNRAKEIIREYGFDFLDLENDSNKMGINDKCDYYNIDHLNTNGMKKLTQYLGNIIVNRYGITNTSLNSRQEAQWLDTVEMTHKFVDLADKLTRNGTERWLFENCELMKELS